MKQLRPLVVTLALLAPVSAFGQDVELRQLATSLIAQVKAKGKGPVAITSFSNDGYSPTFNNFLVDRLIVLLSRENETFDVVARDRVEDVFKELNLVLSKNYDTSTVARIGKQLGARSIIRGSYTIQAAAATVSIVAQIVDVETGRVVGGELINTPFTGDIKAMLAPSASTSSSSIVSETADGVINTFQAASAQAPFRISVGQMIVSSNNRAASVSLTIENRSRDTAFVAFHISSASIGLTDDRATQWQLRQLSGIKRLFIETSKNVEEYTAIGPSERINVVTQWDNLNATLTTPGSMFSFAADASLYLSSGVRQFSVGLSGIKATTLK